MHLFWQTFVFSWPNLEIFLCKLLSLCTFDSIDRKESPQQFQGYHFISNVFDTSVSLSRNVIQLTVCVHSLLWREKWCSFKFPLSENVLTHSEQANGFSPVWVLSCVFKLPLFVNALSHLEQANCFSPLWVLSCVYK